LRIGLAAAVYDADMRVNLQGNEASQKIFDEGEAVLTTDVGYDPELGTYHRIAFLYNCILFPVKKRIQLYGAMLFAASDPNYFTKERCGLLGYHRQAGSDRGSRTRATCIRTWSEEKERMDEVQEETRKKLARDLHDGPTQSLPPWRAYQPCPPYVGKENRGCYGGTGEDRGTGAPYNKEIRHYVVHIASLILESQGLTGRVEQWQRRCARPLSECAHHVDRASLKHGDGKQGVIFYIIEEATTTPANMPMPCTFGCG